MRNSSFAAAHSAMAVGPPAPESTARTAMTTTLSKGCRRLTVERGSSSSAKWRTTSSRVMRVMSVIEGTLWETVCGVTERQVYQLTSQGASVTSYQDCLECALALPSPPL